MKQIKSYIINFFLTFILLISISGCLPERKSFSEARKACNVETLSDQHVGLIVESYVNNLNDVKYQYAKTKNPKVISRFVNTNYRSDSVLVRLNDSHALNTLDAISKSYVLDTHANTYDKILSFKDISSLGCGYYSLLANYVVKDNTSNVPISYAKGFMIIKYDKLTQSWYIYREILDINPESEVN
jgi:hypothetical protein